MEEANRCPECGTEVEQDGTCPACLLKLGLSGAIPAMPEPEPAPPRPAPLTSSARRWRPRWRLGWKWPVAIAALIAIVLVLATPRRPEQFRGPVVRFSLDPPEEATIADFAVSPDGRRLAFTAANNQGQSKLWIHGFDVPLNQEVAGTEGAAAPFWSPDSREVAFFAGGKLKRIDLLGGPAVTLGDAPLVQGGSWSPEGVILFAGRGDGVLLRVPASGGEVTPAAKGAQGGLRWPYFLPDRVSFLAEQSGSHGQIYAGRLNTGEVRKIGDGEAAIYSEDRLIYTRGGVLLSQPFDIHRLEVSGDPVPVRFAKSVRTGGVRAPAFSAGQGVLAYRNGDALSPRVLVWMDRQGKILGQAGEPDDETDFALSPDGRKVAFTRGSPPAGADLWVRDLERGTATRLTFDGPGAASPKWSSDGRKIAYVTSARGRAGIQFLNADGSANQELLLALPQAPTLNDWSADGRFLIYTSREQDGKHAVWMIPLIGDRKPIIVLQGPFHFKQARLSPDGRLLAYVSDEAGREDVYVQSFPPGQGKWMISNEGGTLPVWRRDGRELLYVHAQRRLMRVDIRPGGVLEAGVPRELLEMPGSGSFEAAPDGQRFLVSAPSREERPEPVQIILNWTAETRP